MKAIASFLAGPALGAEAHEIAVELLTGVHSAPGIISPDSGSATNPHRLCRQAKMTFPQGLQSMNSNFCAAALPALHQPAPGALPAVWSLSGGDPGS